MVSTIFSKKLLYFAKMLSMKIYVYFLWKNVGLVRSGVALNCDYTTCDFGRE